MDKIVIGTPECPVSSVLLALKKSPGSFSLFHEAWPDIAMLLETPREKILKLRRDIQVEKLRLTQVLDEVLMEWTTRVGSGATLRKFVGALEGNDLGGCAESLLKELMNEAGNSKIGDGSADRAIGKISYDSSQVVGKGSEGTIVFRGRFDGREVAVKRILPECFTYADREVELLKMSDQHGNVIRYFCTETDGHFRYIALELCVATLGEWVEGKYKNERIDGVRTLKEATKGLEHLHSLKIVHRDVKPANVLLREGVGGERAVRTLISDFGLSKNIEGGGASYAKCTGGAWGTEGWIAPEVILAKYDGTGKMTFAVDIFAMGCLYYYVLSKGDHPFGEVFHRQSNIIKGEYRVDKITGKGPQGAVDLIKLMIFNEARMRPSLTEVLKHPTFWSRRETGAKEATPSKPGLDSTSQPENKVPLEATGANHVTSVKEFAKRFEESLDLNRQPDSHFRRLSGGTVLPSKPPIKPDDRTEIVVKSSDTPKPPNMSQAANSIGSVNVHLTGNIKSHTAVDRAELTSVNGPGCNPRENLHQTALHRAASETEHNLDARLTLMQILLEKGADSYAVDNEGHTFLSILFYHNRLSPSQFHGLCKCLVRRSHAQLFNTRGRFQATPLHLAVLTLEVSEPTLRLLHGNGVHFNLVDDLGESLLHYAIQGGRSVELLSSLIELGTDFRTVNKYGYSPLHKAAELDDLGALAFLLGLGSDVNETNWLGQTPLNRAITTAGKNMLDSVRILIEHGADVTIRDKFGDSAHDIFLKMHKHHVSREKIIKMLGFDIGEDPIHAVSLSLKGLALHSAIDRGDPEAVHHLLKRGLSDINGVDHLGTTVLHRAAFGNYDAGVKLAIIKVLLENGADFQSLYKAKWTFLTILLSSQHQVSPNHFHELCDTLLRKFQKTYFNSPHGFYEMTPLQQMLASPTELGMDTLAMLHHHGVNFNAVNKFGKTVLVSAVSRNRSSGLLSKLIEYGADFRRLDIYKSNLLHCAADYGNLEALAFFIEKGLNVNSVNCIGQTPLHTAAKYADKNVVEVVRYLIEQGADKTIKSKYWHTAHDHAKAREHSFEKEEILRMLGQE